MLRKIEGRYNRREQMAEFVKEADRMIREYGWEEETTMPYGYPVKVTKLLDDCRDYDKCTKGSQEYLVGLANGLAEILNAWEESTKEWTRQPKVTIRMIETGKTVVVTKHVADVCVETGYAELVG